MLQVEKYKTGIKIKKSNRGKFTSYCGGNVTSACIAKGKASSDPAIRKRATFAANARKWKHLYGGIIKGLYAQLDNTRVSRLPHFQPIRRTFLQKLAEFRPFTYADQQVSKLRDKQKRIADIYRKNYHTWQLDPTRPYPKNDLEMVSAYNYASTQAKPILAGIATAGGVTALRYLPKAAKAVATGAKNEGQTFVLSLTTPLGRYLWGQAAKSYLHPLQWTTGSGSFIGNIAFWDTKGSLYQPISGIIENLGTNESSSILYNDKEINDSIDSWFKDLEGGY